MFVNTFAVTAVKEINSKSNMIYRVISSTFSTTFPYQPKHIRNRS